MPINIIEMGKGKVRDLLSKKGGNVIGRLEQAGIINTGLYTENRGKEPQRGYMWEVRFRDGKGRGDYITYYAKNTAVPASMNEHIKRWYAGVEYSYSGRDTSPRMFRVTFWDNQDLEVYKFFLAWYDVMQQGPTNRKVNPNNYMREIELLLNDSLGSQVGLHMTFVDSYPTEIGDVSLAYADTGEFTFDVMFSYRRKVIQ